MYCKFCGTQLPDGSESCSSCGKSLSAPAAPPATSDTLTAGASLASAGTAPSTASGTAVKTIAGLSMRTVAKIALVIALLAFFLPFVTVSCSGGGTELKETYSGMELMTTIGSGDDTLLEESGDDAKANIFVWAAFLCTAAGLAILFTKKESKITGILSACGAAALLIFGGSFKSYYGISGSDYEKYIDVDIRFGLIFCMLCVIVAAVLCFMDKAAPEATNLQQTVTSVVNAITAAAKPQNSQPPAGSPPSAPVVPPAPVNPPAPADSPTPVDPPADEQ